LAVPFEDRDLMVVADEQHAQAHPDDATPDYQDLGHLALL
jgi:hypothetical protein